MRGGPGLRTTVRHGGSGGPGPPAPTVAPVLSWTPVIGNTPSITAGTWTGTPTLRYTLYRGATPDGTEVLRTKAQAEAYVTAAADIAGSPSLTWLEVDTSAQGTNSVSTNAVTFSPSTTLTGCILRLDGAGMDPSGTPWTDTSASAASFTNLTGTPDYSAADADFDNQKSLRFVSANTDGLVSNLTSTYAPFHSGAGMTLAIVFRTSTIGTTEVILDNNNFGSGTGIAVAQFSSGKLRLQLSAGGAQPVDSNTVSISSNTTYRAIFRYKEGDSPEWVITLNGSDSASGDSTSAPTADPPTGALRIGQRTSNLSPFNGKVAAILGWTQSFDANEMATIEAYLAEKYF